MTQDPWARKAQDNARLSAWIIEQIGKLYPTSTHGYEFDRDEARQRLFKMLPYEFVLAADPTREWWFKVFNRSLSTNGYGFPDGSRGTTVVRIWMLPWDEFRALMIGKFCLVKNDRARIRRDTEEWAQRNNPALDVDAAMQGFARAAGL
jgi:hypothetical protein